MAENGSKMVQVDRFITGADCCECGHAKSGQIYIKLRFAKERICICRECWLELVEQVESKF